MRAGKIALAIGDGGNDCAMIQAANVGVGLSGREGLQVCRALPASRMPCMLDYGASRGHAVVMFQGAASCRIATLVRDVLAHGRSVTVA